MASAALRWTGRIWGIASFLLVLAFVAGGEESMRMTASEAVGFLFFPIGVLTGFAIAWRWEGAGGLVSIISLALFYLWMFSKSGSIPAAPYFFLFSAPGFIHAANALAFGSRRTGNASDPNAEASAV